MFVDAIKEIAQLDLLYYVPVDVDVSHSAVSALERELCRHWDADIRLFLCPRYKSSESQSKWNRYVAGSMSFFRQDGHVATSYPQQVQAFEKCLGLMPDLVFAHKLASMCPLLLTRKTLPPILFDLDDVEHVAFLRGIESQRRWYSRLLTYSRFPALFFGEQRAIRLAYRTFVCSETDRNYLAERWKLPGVVTIPNSVTSAKYLPLTSEPTLLFLGAYYYKPNSRAADFLIKEIWPHILRAYPSARLVVAGPQPESIGAYSSQTPGVEFTGFVENLEALYRRSRVVCCPILSGGGTRIKIIEAAAHRKAVVATRIGAEGLEFRDGHELLLRDDPKSFANACVELLANDSLCERLGSAAYEAAVRHYSRAKIEASIRTHIMAARDAGGLAPFPGPFDEARSA